MSAALPLLSVDQALAYALASAPDILGIEDVDISEAYNRTLAQDLKALRTQPPFAASAMDGYAVRAQDVAGPSPALDVIGISAAGHGFSGEVGPGQAVRIFTGAPVPAGADAILIQENAALNGDRVTALESVAVGRHIRAAGLDFFEGDALLERGIRLGPAELALAAAMGHARVPAARRPKVALLATGDELVPPGAQVGPDQIVASNSYAVAAYAQAAGAQVLDLGIAADNFEALEAGVRAAQGREADVLVTLGGASVGEHDLVQAALAQMGMRLSFWRVAMRPGKPLMHGQIGPMRVLGLPGNPVSAIVCAILFLVPMIRALCGDPRAAEDASEPAALGADMGRNDSRQDYVRGSLSHPGGVLTATPFTRQDSSMLRTLAESQALIVRAPHAEPARAGDPCRILRLAPRP